MKHSVFIIAEVGVNHNGSINRALKMIEVAANAGVDAVKFQTFSADALVTQTAQKADYQQKTTDADESQYEMLRRLEFGASDFEILQKACREFELEFLSTPFDLDSIDLLASLGMSCWKLPSGEITNLPYLRKIGARNESVILSTGMSNIEEIEAAVEVLESAGTERNKITILHCNSEYPTAMEDVNLRAMNGMLNEIPGLAGVGYSDHTPGIEIPVAACALGAQVLEKHFTLDRNLPGPDHKASLEPSELEEMVRSIRNVEIALGSSTKVPSPSEIRNRTVARKSIVAAEYIPKGEVLSETKLTVKRPGKGISPMKWDQVVGRKANRDYAKDELIEV